MKNLLVNIKKNKKKAPKLKYFYKWIKYFNKNNFIILNIKIVNIKEITYLNKKYKKKNKETNVLTFNLNFNKNKNIIGDIVFCNSIIKKEAKILKKI